MAARFNDDGVTALFQSIAPALVAKGLKLGKPRLPIVSVKASSRGRAIVPAERARYLAEIADSVRGYHKHTAEQARVARRGQHRPPAHRLSGDRQRERPRHEPEPDREHSAGREREYDEPGRGHRNRITDDEQRLAGGHRGSHRNPHASARAERAAPPAHGAGSTAASSTCSIDFGTETPAKISALVANVRTTA